jgi:8-oxo-dGTP pyrophosphatase MutT (NUDIX family)
MKYILEFPSGMMDDVSIEGNATRELKEETGYTGNPYPFEEKPTKYFTDPWKSPETGHLMIYNIDGDAPENENPI